MNGPADRGPADRGPADRGPADRGPAYPSAYPAPATQEPLSSLWQETFQSLQGRRRIAEWLILGHLAIKLGYGAMTVWVLLIRARVVPQPMNNYLEVYDAFALFMVLVFLATLTTAGLFFIRWQRQAIRNMKALGCQKIRHGIELASWSWFIPFVAWVLPYQSIAQVAQYSRPRGGPNTLALVGLWWAAWLGFGLLNRIVGLLAFLVETEEDWVRMNNFELAAIGVEVIAGLLAILVMRWLSRQQEEHHRRLTAAHPPA